MKISTRRAGASPSDTCLRSEIDMCRSPLSPRLSPPRPPRKGDVKTALRSFARRHASSLHGWPVRRLRQGAPAILMTAAALASVDPGDRGADRRQPRPHRRRPRLCGRDAPPGRTLRSMSAARDATSPRRSNADSAADRRSSRSSDTPEPSAASTELWCRKILPTVRGRMDDATAVSPRSSRLQRPSVPVISSAQVPGSGAACTDIIGSMALVMRSNAVSSAQGRCS